MKKAMSFLCTAALALSLVSFPALAAGEPDATMVNFNGTILDASQWKADEKGELKVADGVLTMKNPLTDASLIYELDGSIPDNRVFNFDMKFDTYNGWGAMLMLRDSSAAKNTYDEGNQSYALVIGKTRMELKRFNADADVPAQRDVMLAGADLSADFSAGYHNVMAAVVNNGEDMVDFLVFVDGVKVLSFTETKLIIKNSDHANFLVDTGVTLQLKKGAPPEKVPMQVLDFKNQTAGTWTNAGDTNLAIEAVADGGVRFSNKSEGMRTFDYVGSVEDDVVVNFRFKYDQKPGWGCQMPLMPNAASGGSERIIGKTATYAVNFENGFVSSKHNGDFLRYNPPEGNFQDVTAGLAEEFAIVRRRLDGGKLSLRLYASKDDTCKLVDEWTVEAADVSASMNYFGGLLDQRDGGQNKDTSVVVYPGTGKFPADAAAGYVSPFETFMKGTFAELKLEKKAPTTAGGTAGGATTAQGGGTNPGTGAPAPVALLLLAAASCAAVLILRSKRR